MKKSYLLLTIITLGILFLGFQSYSNNQNIMGIFDFFKKTPDKEEPKEFSFDDAWSAVAAKENKSLYKDAWNEVKKIRTKAIELKNYPQLIKTYIFTLDYQNRLEDDGFFVETQEMEGLFKNIPDPYSSVLHSIMGEIYMNYLKDSYYKIKNRSNADVDENDLKTFSTKQVLQKAKNHYLASYQNENLIKNSSDEIKDLLQKTLNHNEPTIYDVLIKRALNNFFESDISSYEVFDDNFDNNNNELLSDFENFINLKFDESEYSESSNYKTFKIYQKLIELHKKDSNTESLIINDLERLMYYYKKSNSEDKITLYREALKNLEEKFKNDENCARIKLAIADHYYSCKNFVEAHKKCEEIVEKYPNSESFKKGAETIIHNIEIPEINCTSDDYVSSNQEIQLKFNYKNLDKIYLRIGKISRKSITEIERTWNQENKLNLIKSEMSSVENFVVNTSPTDDYKSKNIDFKIPKQNLGNYAILISNDSTFKKDVVKYTLLQVTNITTVKTNNWFDNNLKIKVLDRMTGEPIDDATIKIYRNSYKNGKWMDELIATKKSDSNGDCILSENESKNIEYTVEKGKDYFDRRSAYGFEINDVKIESKNYKIFTDRALYRPGQTVYFKVIGFSQLKNNAKVLAGQKVNIQVKDINYQIIYEENVELNDYGSACCNFKLGTALPLGRFAIYANYSIAANFQVEEYKLPTFEVKTESPENEIVVNSNVKIKGNATTYSGVKLNGAKVKYEITRSPKYRGWWSFYYPIKDKQIANGETSTNENGDFEIDFLAKPDPTLPKDKYLTFTYTVKVDVTDINGETQSTTNYFSVGYAGLYLNKILMNETYIKDRKSFDELAISTTNASGNHIDAIVNVKVSKLENFEKPDRNNKLEDLKVEKTLKEFDVNTATEKRINFSFLEDYEDGNYSVMLTAKDSFGNEMESESRFTLISANCKKADFNKYFWSNVEKSSCEVGETAKIIVGSSMKNVNCYYEVCADDKFVRKETKIILNNNSQTIEIPILEEHRGGISARLFFVKDNEFKTEEFSISVPATDKKIQIKFESFRDKLEPGENETIKLKILDKNLKPIDAELLATLYDESIDAILKNNWYFNIFRSNEICDTYESECFRSSQSQALNTPRTYWYSTTKNRLDINWFYHSVTSIGKPEIRVRGVGSVLFSKSAVYDEGACYASDLEMEMEEEEVAANAVNMTLSKKAKGVEIETEEESDEFSDVKVRENFAETALFSGNLVTDENGDISIQFTIPETLTKWHFKSLAHTKDMIITTAENHLVTQKTFSVEPNLPRFFMEKDEISIPVKISNLSDKELSGKVKIEILDAISQQAVSDYKIDASIKTFTVEPERTALQEFTLTIPKRPEPVIVKVVGIADDHSDGSQKFVPVLTTRTLITESQSLYIRGNQTKNFTINTLQNQSKTQDNQRLTFEFTSNPAWLAFMSLQYLRENPYDCYEQLFSKYYSNSVARKIITSNPDFENTFEKLSEEDFKSALEKNQELKSIMLNETPWLLDAKSESQNMKDLAHLFNEKEITESNKSFIKKLKDGQYSNGGWPWFAKMHENTYITQYILSGFGKLIAIGAIENSGDVKLMTDRAISFIDNKLEEEYKELKKILKKDELKKYVPGNYAIQYFYARSFFKDTKISKSTTEAYNYFLERIIKNWTSYSMLTQAILATSLKRIDKQDVALEIIKSFQNNAQYSDKFGMYYSKNLNGYYWYNSPIETQAMIIEAFAEFGMSKEVEELKIWLIKNKQTNSWKSTRATTEAVYALLMNGEKYSGSEEKCRIKIGNEILNQENASSGSSYIKTSFSPSEITSEKANIEIVNPNNHIAYGATYLQYFVDMEDVKSTSNGLKIEKKIFIIKKNNRGEDVLTEITPNTIVNQGDKLKARFVITTDRDLEYVFLKDHHSAGFEPLNKLSGVRYQDGLVYYESTKDASEEFFLDFMSRGTYVFEYPLVAVHKGKFTNGIASVECMYAPEFMANSISASIIVK